MKHLQIGIENRTCHGLVIYGYWNDMFGNCLAKYIGPPHCG